MMIKSKKGSAEVFYVTPRCSVWDVLPQSVLCASFKNSNGIEDATEEDWGTLSL